jgi:hypothetical protein
MNWVIIVGLILVYKYKYEILLYMIKLRSMYYNYKNRGLKKILTKSIKDDLHVHKLKYNGEDTFIFHEKDKIDYNEVLKELQKVKENCKKVLLCNAYDELNQEHDITDEFNKFSYHFDKEHDLSLFLEYIKLEYKIDNIKHVLFIRHDLEEKTIVMEDISLKFKELF